ncbi:OmpA family protein [Enterovibrio sp. ZSDZ42]|uniref:OmpA family protein n=1 Tax=Enterovibrio gelatinilyticus TaxID=2899819 RepID=A0ABT5R1D9_9GAMM|nr:OmpA family protein [Enterovibrio sp. ZSDZ42]MDD1794091.1 OmpA family protein [Enterovibrio sp. ZSDZ42]
MNKLILLIPALFLAGCANQEIVTMQDTSSQVNDLRDLDYDGVIKARELCDETLNGASVNNDGCPKDKTIKQSFRLDVKFANDSSKLLPSNYAKLEQLAAFLEEQDGAVVTIEGHASKVGNPAYNLALSQRRADAVANALVEDFDIPVSRVEAIGYGDAEPLIDEDSELAHETNRRVMASLSGEYSTTDMRWTIFTSE